MKLPYAWRFALGTLWCLAALGGCAEGTLRREDAVGPGDNPFPSQLTFTRGTLARDGNLPPHTVLPRVVAEDGTLLPHTVLPRFSSPATDAGLADDVDAAAPSDAAVPTDAATDAAPSGDAGNDAGNGHGPP